MEVRKSQIINASCIYIEGIGFLGTSAEVEIPAIEFETYEQNGGFYKQNLNTGILKTMTAKFIVSEFNSVIYESFSKQFNKSNPSNLYVKWNVSSPKGHFDHIATFRGDITKHTPPKVAAGEEVKCEFELQLSFLKLEDYGVESVLIDTNNLICRIGGTDLWEEIRSNL